MRLRIRVSRYQQFGRLANRFRAAAGGDLRRDAVQELGAASQPVLARVRAGVLAGSYPAVADHPAAQPSPKSESTALRARLAAATHVTPLPRGNGVRFAVEGKEVGDRGHRLAQLTDKTTAPRWRHPIFGNREQWVTQQGQPWFFSNISAGRPEFEVGIRRAMDRTARKITGGR